MRGFRLMRAGERSFRRAGLIVVIGALLTGCAAGGYDAGSVHRHLVDAGLSAKEADCVVLRMGPRFGDERLGSHTEVTSVEIAAMRELLRGCNVRVAARSFPR
jgi:hypothetical protein